MNDFGTILEVSLQVDGNSDFDYPSCAIFKFSVLQGVPESQFFQIFL